MNTSHDVSKTIPHRKEIRSWLTPFRVSRSWLAVGLLSMDWVLFACFLTGTVFFEYWPVKTLMGLGAGLMICRLFVIGHDACHQSLTRHKVLNKWLGRIAMLPSLTPYSLWQVGHNVVHHGYTNLKGVDFVWAPLTLSEYEALPSWRQYLERIYRSGWATGFYYLIEIWWLRMYFPGKKYLATERPEFLWDNILVTVTAVAWIGSLFVLSSVLNQSFWLLMATGFLLPQIVWNTVIGFVVYVHHTHPDVAWYDDKQKWGKAAPFVSTTVHMKFPYGIGLFFHNIMEHTAHHVDMSIPLYTLEDAQSTIEEAVPEQVTVQRFSFPWYFQTARQCKLYDFERGSWIDFQGQPTSAS